MAAKKTKTLTPAALLLCAVAALLAVLIFVKLVNPDVKSAEVKYTADAKTAAVKQGYDDNAFIRISGVLDNKKISSLDEWKASAQSSVDASGYFVCDDIVKVGRSRVRLVISARKPLLTVSMAGEYVTLDSEGYVLGRAKSYSQADGTILVQGLALRYVNPGSSAVVESSEQKLTDALKVASVIRDNALESTYLSFTMLDDRYVSLKSSSGVPVRINMRFDVLKDLLAAREVLKTGRTGGHIEAVNGNVYFEPDAEDNYAITGM
ncbi:MAG: hypothetical protein IKR85_04590 [Clostridia bacterium]|nr:hypothetical protein [Clostridia bacterium]